jgi:hypothetical protein
VTARRPWLGLALAAALLMACAGCGLDIEEPDLFLLTRTGQGTKLTPARSVATAVRPG